MKISLEYLTILPEVFLLLGEWKGQSIRALICSALQIYFPSQMLMGMLIYLKGASWTLLEKWFWYLLIKFTHIKQIVVLSISVFKLATPLLSLSVENLEAVSTGSVIRSWGAELHWCRQILVLLQGWSRLERNVSAAGLQETAENSRIYRSMNRCLNSRLMAAKLMETNNQSTVVDLNSSWSSESMRNLKNRKIWKEGMLMVKKKKV